MCGYRMMWRLSLRSSNGSAVQGEALGERRFVCPLDSIRARRCILKPRRQEGAITIVTTLKVPKTGGLPTTKVNVVRWFKQEGDTVKRGDAVVELETEKVNYELDSPMDGVLLKILMREGAEVPVGDPICQIGQPGDNDGTKLRSLARGHSD